MGWARDVNRKIRKTSRGLVHLIFVFIFILFSISVYTTTMANKIVIFVALACLGFAALATAQTIPDQDSGYVTVRSKAHMFWYAQ